MRSVRQSLLPGLLTVITFVVLIILLLGLVTILNVFPLKEKIISEFRITDILIGVTIYLKTSVDFALFIGNLLTKEEGYKNHTAIEVGTSLGNGIGTFLVLIIWTFFKEIPLLLVIMILLAALVLFGMAEESLNTFRSKLINNNPQTYEKKTLSRYWQVKCIWILQFGFGFLLHLLHGINVISSPLLSRILPHTQISTSSQSSTKRLFFYSFSIPFILGLDDFAGYIPLFSILNIVSFSTGVFLGHMLLLLCLFASPRQTANLMKRPLIELLGGLAFLAIAAWGLVEISHLIFSLK
jgi:hypothetical protein